MIQLPIWLWVVSVLGVIAAGIGLGYLIIFLFWKIEKHFRPQPVIPKYFKEEVKVEESIKQPEPVKEPVLEKEMFPVMVEPISGEKNRLIKFTTILHHKFNHPFHEANTIVCWNIDLKNGDEIRDAEDKVMKLRVIEPQNESEHTRYILVDESGQQQISIIHGKDYVKRETNLDFDKMTR